jgi:arylformamidase
MSGIDYEAEYNNRKRVPEHPEIMERWNTLSAAYRLEGQPETDKSYGSRERQRYDLFKAGEDAPLVVYIHGGYWQRGDRKDFSFVAKEFNAGGLAVAMPSYSLCPAASVAEIVDEMVLFLAALWKKTRKHPVVIGHSAGGHLAASMVATDWSRVAGVPADLVRAGCAISGVFDLPPLVGTSLNEALGLTNGTARAASPRFRPAPAKGRRFVAAVGGAESGEFLRQARDIVDHWKQAGVDAEYLEVPGANHFTILDELTNPASPLFLHVAALAREVNGDGGA